MVGGCRWRGESQDGGGLRRRVTAWSRACWRPALQPEAAGLFVTAARADDPANTEETRKVRRGALPSDRRLQKEELLSGPQDGAGNNSPRDPVWWTNAGREGRGRARAPEAKPTGILIYPSVVTLLEFLEQTS